MLRVTLFHVLLWLSVVVGFAQSPPPKQVAAPQTQKSGVLDKAEDAPLVVNVVESPTQKQQATNNQKNGDEKFLNRLFLTVDGWTVLILFSQSALLWWTIKAMRKSDEQQLRAYVSFVIDVTDPIPGEQYPVNFTCVNHGTTPAKDIGFRGGIWLVQLPMAHLPRIADGFDEERMNVFPGAENPRAIRSNTQRTFSREELEQVANGSHALVVGLKIRYWDMFDKMHETQEYFWITGRGARRSVMLVPGSSKIT